MGVYVLEYGGEVLVSDQRLEIRDQEKCISALVGVVSIGCLEDILPGDFLLF